MSGAEPLLSIIIVSWNVCDLLRVCLQSILDHGRGLSLEIIVVDSGSSDGTAAMVAAEFATIRLLAQHDNVGFARGNNIGMAAARGELLLLLNPDTVIVGDALQQMVSALRQRPQVGLLGPRLINPDGSLQPSRRRFPTLLTAIFESTWLQPHAPAAILRDYTMSDISEHQIVAVDWVTGACMLTRAAIFRQTRGFDEGYFMYSEELDWCRRIKQVGWQIVYAPTATVLHHVGRSSEQAVTLRHINFNRARLRYFRKFHGRVAYHLLRSFLLLSYGHQLLLEAAKGALGHRRPLRRQRVQAYREVLRSGLRAAGY